MSALCGCAYLHCRCMQLFIIRNWDVVVVWKGADWDIMSLNVLTQRVCGVHCVCRYETSTVQYREHAVSSSDEYKSKSANLLEPKASALLHLLSSSKENTQVMRPKLTFY